MRQNDKSTNQVSAAIDPILQNYKNPIKTDASSPISIEAYALITYVFNSNVTNSAILNRITNFYLGSSQFNGMPARSLADRLELSLDELRPSISPLIETEQVSIVYGDRHPNPHIRALPDEPISVQIEKLYSDRLERACLYPLSDHLDRVVNKTHFIEKPYTLELALGSPQYTFAFFDPSVLDQFLTHAESHVQSDIEGRLTLKDKTVRYARAAMGSKYVHPFTELIALNLEQLTTLAPSVQQSWQIMSIPGEGVLHPDTQNTLLEGALRERVSIFEAVMEEMRAVNRLIQHLNKPPLFLFHLDSERAIQHFGFLPTPNYKHFSQFFLNLQILLFQNVNPAFLASIEVPKRPVLNKKTTSHRRPAQTALEYVNEWLKKTFPIHAEGPILKLVDSVKKTRLDLQCSSNFLHSLDFDRSLFHLQRRLMWHAYHAVKSIRLVLEHCTGYFLMDLHPLVREEKVWVV